VKTQVTRRHWSRYLTSLEAKVAHETEREQTMTYVVHRISAIARTVPSQSSGRVRAHFNPRGGLSRGNLEMHSGDFGITDRSADPQCSAAPVRNEINVTGQMRLLLDPHTRSSLPWG